MYYDKINPLGQVA